MSCLQGLLKQTAFLRRPEVGKIASAAPVRSPCGRLLHRSRAKTVGQQCSIVSVGELVYCRYIGVSICGVTKRKHEIPPPLSTPDSRLTPAKPFFHRLLPFPPDTVPPPRPLLYCAPSQREGEAEAHHVVDGAAASAASASVGSPVCASSMHPTSGLLDRGRVILGRVDVCGKCGSKRVGESERSS